MLDTILFFIVWVTNMMFGSAKLEYEVVIIDCVGTPSIRKRKETGFIVSKK